MIRISLFGACLLLACSKPSGNATAFTKVHFVHQTIDYTVNSVRFVPPTDYTAPDGDNGKQFTGAWVYGDEAHFTDIPVREEDGNTEIFVNVTAKKTCTSTTTTDPGVTITTVNCHAPRGDLSATRNLSLKDENELAYQDGFLVVNNNGFGGASGTGGTGGSSGSGSQSAQLSTTCDDLLTKWSTATNGNRSTSTCGASMTSSGDKRSPTPSNGDCVRDSYVDAAVADCWAAMCYAYFGQSAKMTEMTDSAKAELSNADSLCSKVIVIGPSDPCVTEAIHACP
jgi:hypothetical protein